MINNETLATLAATTIHFFIENFFEKMDRSRPSKKQLQHAETIIHNLMALPKPARLEGAIRFFSTYYEQDNISITTAAKLVNVLKSEWKSGRARKWHRMVAKLALLVMKDEGCRFPTRVTTRSQMY